MWTEIDNRLCRELEFSSFSQAISFMVQVAFLAEKLDHHPNWSNVYNKVIIQLTSHDAGNRITEKDYTLARQIDALLATYTNTI